ncbi:tRNA1(Val) (adenine(37)-N6)-methyltransferase [Ekhidna sp.]|uniref:tRNA1(Val) (adenine(37)-N6)-methyltransferase n=1 Tax=Ekhidna sp. TaxID=2608089 RepID=UPI003C7B6E61
MPNTYFQFKQFRIEQAQSGMKVTTDGCLFGGWVAEEIQKETTEPKRILDIGAGTGLLSLMLAQVTVKGEIMALEINEAACKEAIHNFHHSPWGERLQCRHTSLQNFNGDNYGLIICNPPFFKGSQQGADRNKNQAVHSNSLDAEELLDHVIRLLDPNGSLYLLYPEREMEAFRQMALTKGLYPIHQVIVRNQIDQSIFRVMARFSFEEVKAITSELIIRKANRKYTTESWKLLKEYYLEYNNPGLQ